MSGSEWAGQRLGGCSESRKCPGQALAASAEGLEFTESRPLGGTWVLDGLWARLEIGAAMRRLLKGRRLDAAAERVLFALVANRALAPSSKLAAARWASEDVLIDGLPSTTDDACYRAMDWLLEVKDALEKEVFHQVANLLNLEAGLLFFDTRRQDLPRQRIHPVPELHRARLQPHGGDLRRNQGGLRELGNLSQLGRSVKQIRPVRSRAYRPGAESRLGKVRGSSPATAHSAGFAGCGAVRRTPQLRVSRSQPCAGTMSPSRPSASSFGPAVK